MKWRQQLMERAKEGIFSRFVWWVHKAEAEKRIRLLIKENTRLKGQLKRIT